MKLLICCKLGMKATNDTVCHNLFCFVCSNEDDLSENLKQIILDSANLKLNLQKIESFENSSRFLVSPFCNCPRFKFGFLLWVPAHGRSVCSCAHQSSLFDSYTCKLTLLSFYLLLKC